MFTWRDPGVLADGDLQLVLIEKYPGDESKGLVPAVSAL